jgi:hypothetical protein
MMSSLSSGSVVRTTVRCSANTHIGSGGSVRSKSYRLRKQAGVPVLHIDCNVQRILSLRFRWKVALNELGISRDCISVISGPNEKLLSTRHTRGSFHRRPYFPSIDQRVVFLPVTASSPKNIALWHCAHILDSRIVPELSEYCVLTDMKEKYSPPCTVQKRKYTKGNSSMIHTVHCIVMSISCYRPQRR